MAVVLLDMAGEAKDAANFLQCPGKPPLPPLPPAVKNHPV